MSISLRCAKSMAAEATRGSQPSRLVPVIWCALAKQHRKSRPHYGIKPEFWSSTVGYSSADESQWTGRSIRCYLPVFAETLIFQRDRIRFGATRLGVTFTRVTIGGSWAGSSMVEQLPLKQRVGGSSPPRLTTSARMNLGVAHRRLCYGPGRFRLTRPSVISCITARDSPHAKTCFA